MSKERRTSLSKYDAYLEFEVGCSYDAKNRVTKYDFDQELCAIDNINERWFLVEKTGLFYDRLDKKEVDRAQLKMLWKNEPIEVREMQVDEVEKRKSVQVKKKDRFETWTSHPARLQVKDMIFNPLKAPLTIDRDGYFNTFAGLATTPLEGEYPYFQELVDTVICDGDSEKCNFVWNWLASLLFDPSTRQTALFLSSVEEGTGKSSFCEYLRCTLGNHHYKLFGSLEEAAGRFSAWKKECLLVVVDEGKDFRLNKADVDKLKSMLTADFQQVEQKFKDVAEMRVWFKMILCANSETAILGGDITRRFQFLKVNPCKKKDLGFWKGLYAEMNGSGPSALLYALSKRPMNKDLSRTVVRTKEGLQSASLSMDDVNEYVYACLQEGKWNPTKQCAVFYEAEPKFWFYDEFVDWCKDKGKKHIKNNVWFWRAIGDLQKKNILKFTDSRRSDGTRYAMFDMSREAAYSAFCSYYGLDHNEPMEGVEGKNIFYFNSPKEAEV